MARQRWSNARRTGRPRKTTLGEDKYITLTSRRSRRLTAPEITAQINRSHDLSLSTSTVQRRLREASLFGRVAIKKPLLRQENKRKRLRWAREHKNWTREQWDTVLCITGFRVAYKSVCS